MKFNGTAHFFTFSLIVEGGTEKVSQFIMPLKSIYNKNFGFIQLKCTFENDRKVKERKEYENDAIFVIKCCDYFCRAALYRLMLV